MYVYREQNFTISKLNRNSRQINAYINMFVSVKAFISYLINLGSEQTNQL